MGKPSIFITVANCGRCPFYRIVTVMDNKCMFCRAKEELIFEDEFDSDKINTKCPLIDNDIIVMKKVGA